MEAEPDRSAFWRELRMALIAAKAAPNAEVRDAFLEQAGEWAERLADTAAPEGQEPRASAYFLDMALTDIGNDEWATPL